MKSFDQYLSEATKEQNFVKGIMKHGSPNFFDDTNKIFSFDGKTYFLMALIPHDGFVQFKELRVPEEFQKKGLGTEAMQEVLKDADKQGIVLKLDAVPFTKEISKSKLVKFYKKFGFVKDDGSVGKFQFELVRYPK